MHMWSVFVCLCSHVCVQVPVRVCMCVLVYIGIKSLPGPLPILFFKTELMATGLSSQLAWGTQCWNYRWATVDSAVPNPSPHTHPARALTTHLIPSPYLSILKYFHLLDPPACQRGEIFFNVLFYRCFNNTPLLFCC